MTERMLHDLCNINNLLDDDDFCILLKLNDNSDLTQDEVSEVIRLHKKYITGKDTKNGK